MFPVSGAGIIIETQPTQRTMALAVTLALGAAILYLLVELYRRMFFHYTDTDAVATLWGIVSTRNGNRPCSCES